MRCSAPLAAVSWTRPVICRAASTLTGSCCWGLRLRHGRAAVQLTAASAPSAGRLERKRKLLQFLNGTIYAARYLADESFILSRK